jgi:hypothetical protein
MFCPLEDMDRSLHDLGVRREDLRGSVSCLLVRSGDGCNFRFMEGFDSF